MTVAAWSSLFAMGMALALVCNVLPVAASDSLDGGKHIAGQGDERWVADDQDFEIIEYDEWVAIDKASYLKDHDSDTDTDTDTDIDVDTPTPVPTPIATPVPTPIPTTTPTEPAVVEEFEFSSAFQITSDTPPSEADQQGIADKAKDELVADLMADLGLTIEEASDKIEVTVIIEEITTKATTYKITIIVKVKAIDLAEVQALQEDMDSADELTTLMTEGAGLNITFWDPVAQPIDTSSFETVQVTAVPSATPSPSVAPSASPAASPSPSASPSASVDVDDKDNLLIALILGVGIGGSGLLAIVCYCMNKKKKEAEAVKYSEDLAESHL